MSAHRPLVRFISLLGFVLLVSLLPGTALAQGQGNGGGNGKGNGNGGEEPPIVPLDVTDTIPPSVDIQPSGGTYSEPMLQVTICWSDDKNLEASTRTIKHMATDVTSNFTWQSVPFCALAAIVTPPDGLSGPTAAPSGETDVFYKSEGTINLSKGTKLTASIRDKPFGNLGKKTVFYTYQPPSYDAPTVTLPKHNGDNRDRSLCLTSGAGEGAAYQCGDLLVAHAMPAYATKGRDRSLTLLYNTDQAAPKGVVTADVGFPSAADPDSMEAQLWVKSVKRASAVYDGVPWSGQTYQISMGFGATNPANWPSGLYPFELTARAFYGATTPMETPVQDTLIVVNRRASEFGLGWSLAGVERLVLDQPNATVDDILWIGGDGSAKRYRKSASVWIGAAGAFRDTITLSGGVYTRRLKHGVKVQFNSSGEHVKTINRVGDETTFTWQTLGAHRRLTSIEVPTAGATTHDTYTLHYSGTPATLDSIVDPTGRVLAATIDGSGRLTGLTDPDGEGVTFTYKASGKLASRTNRRGFQTTYWYDNNYRLTDVKVTLDASGPDWAHTRFTNWDESWLALGIGATPKPRLTNVRTTINGPRTNVNDFAWFWIDRWGAPTRIQDPLFKNTYVTRGEGGSPPALPTTIKYPNNRIVRLAWNGRGNLTSQRDSTSHISGTGLPTSWSRWTYGDSSVPDSPTEIAVGPDSLVTRITYSGSLGLPDTLVGPNDHRTVFAYTTSGDGAGLVRSVTEESVDVFTAASNTTSAQDLVTSFGYDAFGNLERDTFPNGGVRVFERDAFNRISKVTNQVGDVTEFEYDALNRLKKHIQTIEGGAKLTTTTYWGIDHVDSIADPRGVKRRFLYDDAGRLAEERDGWNKSDRHIYDEAGNLTSILPRHLTGLQDSAITMTYDVMNRLKTKVWPDRDRPHAGWPGTTWEFTIPGDSLTMSYDPVMGWLTGAEVGDWKVERDYYASGLLKESREIDREHAAPDTLLHQRFGYDGMGRRIKHVIGAGSDADSVWYNYEPASGDLEEVGVKWRTTVRDSVRFVWDALGRRKHVQFSPASGGVNGALEILYSYDKLGTLRRVCATHHGTNDPTDVFRFRMEHEAVDLLGRALDTRLYDQSDPECESANQTPPSSRRNTFDKRGQLVRQVASDSTEYAYDSSGNLVRIRQWSLGGIEFRHDTMYMFPSVNRIDLLNRNLHPAETPYSTVLDYGFDGVRVREKVVTAGYLGKSRRYWYDALGRMSGMEFYEPYYCNPLENCVVTLPEACVYGPLGQQRTSCSGYFESRPPLYYDGDNIVRTGADGRDLAWTFVHGPGLDDPLMGMYEGTVGTGGARYLYWITDGQGRQYAVAEEDGQPIAITTADWTYTHKYAGGIQQAETFENSRLSTDDSPGISFYRNRAYDQATGKWLQEDPIGIAGGLNLYQYAGNNPATYTDPFGLMPPCYDRNGKRIPCPEPPGGPPVEVPGGDGSGWRPIPGSVSRPTKWIPNVRVPSPKGGQPGASWDPSGGHWDVDDGTGRRRRYTPDGVEVDHHGNPVGQPGQAPNAQTVEGAKAVGTAVLIYWIISAGSRLFPPRNLIPVP